MTRRRPAPAILPVHLNTPRPRGDGDDRARRVQHHALGREQLLERAWPEDVGDMGRVLFARWEKKGMLRQQLRA